MSSAKKEVRMESSAKRRRRLKSHENKRKVVRKMVKGPLQINLSLVSQDQDEPENEFPQDKGVLNVVEVGNANLSMKSTRYQNKNKVEVKEPPLTDRTPTGGHSDFTFHAPSQFHSVSHNKKRIPLPNPKIDKENQNMKNVF